MVQDFAGPSTNQYLFEPPRWRPRRDWRRPELGWTEPWSSARRRRRRSNLCREKTSEKCQKARNKTWKISDIFIHRIYLYRIFIHNLEIYDIVEVCLCIDDYHVNICPQVIPAMWLMTSDDWYRSLVWKEGICPPQQCLLDDFMGIYGD